MGLSSFKFVQSAPKTHLFCNRVRFGRSRASKVDNFGSNRKRENFLLVRHCDYGPILHRFWDTATYWLKIAHFSYPSLIRRPLPMFPLDFCAEVNREKTRVMGLSYGEDPMIVASVILTQCQRVTDKRTDGQTDRQTDGRTDLLWLIQRSAEQAMLTRCNNKKLSYCCNSRSNSMQYFNAVHCDHNSSTSE